MFDDAVTLNSIEIQNIFMIAYPLFSNTFKPIDASFLTSPIDDNWYVFNFSLYHLVLLNLSTPPTI